jgi:hypothetical protein
MMMSSTHILQSITFNTRDLIHLSSHSSHAHLRSSAAVDAWFDGRRDPPPAASAPRIATASASPAAAASSSQMPEEELSLPSSRETLSAIEGDVIYLRLLAAPRIFHPSPTSPQILKRCSAAGILVCYRCRCRTRSRFTASSSDSLLSAFQHLLRISNICNSFTARPAAPHVFAGVCAFSHA